MDVLQGAVRALKLIGLPCRAIFDQARRYERLEFAPGARTRDLTGFSRGRPAPEVLRDPQRRLAFIDGLLRDLARNRVEHEPAVAARLTEERARAEMLADGRKSLPAAMKTLTTLRRKLYPYQRDGVRRFFEQGRLLLADDMGLGKTTQAISACHGLLHTGRVQKGLLIVPAALKAQWKREWDAAARAPLTVVDGTPEARDALYRGTTRGFLVIGYEQLLRDFASVQRFAPELVVLDEAQRIKNWATKSAAYVKALAPRYRLVLTGTPMENRLEELASILDFVDDVALEPKWRLAPWSR